VRTLTQLAAVAAALLALTNTLEFGPSVVRVVVSAGAAIVAAVALATAEKPGGGLFSWLVAGVTSLCGCSVSVIYLQGVM
jgi:hypothetical protein